MYITYVASHLSIYSFIHLHAVMRVSRFSLTFESLFSHVNCQFPFIYPHLGRRLVDFCMLKSPSKTFSIWIDMIMHSLQLQLHMSSHASMFAARWLVFQFAMEMCGGTVLFSRKFISILKWEHISISFSYWNVRPTRHTRTHTHIPMNINELSNQL